MAQEFCPRCGTPRLGAFRFCRSCQFDYDETPESQSAPAVLPATPTHPPSSPATSTVAATTGGTVQPQLANVLLDMESMRLKLIPIRILGLLAGLAIWWFVVGPIAGTDNPLIVMISLPVFAFGGLWAGNVVGLSLLRGR